MTWDPAIATAVGALAGALNNYVLCSQVVFGGNSGDRHLPDHTRPARSLIRFFLCSYDPRVAQWCLFVFPPPGHQ